MLRLFVLLVVLFGWCEPLSLLSRGHRDVRCGAKKGGERPRVRGLSNAAKVHSPLLSEKDEVLLIDGDNVRGKSGWVWPAAELVRAAEVGCASRGVPTVVFLDHALRPEFVALRCDAGVSFAGPERTADDAIVDALRCLPNTRVALVTSDFGLRQRVVDLGQPVRFVSSLALLEDLRASRQEARSMDDVGYLAPFDRALKTLAAHVSRTRSGTMTRRDREILAATRFVNATAIPREQTWMRSLLNERLRRLLTATERPLLPVLETLRREAAGRDETLRDRRRLSDHLSDHHLSQLARFGDSLRGLEPVPFEPASPIPAVAPLKLSRRRKRLLSKAINLDSPGPAKRAASKQPDISHIDLDELEATLDLWLAAPGEPRLLASSPAQAAATMGAPAS